VNVPPSVDLFTTHRTLLVIKSIDVFPVGVSFSCETLGMEIPVGPWASARGYCSSEIDECMVSEVVFFELAPDVPLLRDSYVVAVLALALLLMNKGLMVGMQAQIIPTSTSKMDLSHDYGQRVYCGDYLFLGTALKPTK
jgi:hypothetical protein